jgi:hypothetical protein
MKELLAPNGTPSNLTTEQYKLVRTPAFKQWFGDWENDPENSSKIVDENGEPKVVARMDDIRKYNYGEEYPIFFCEKEDVKYFTEFGTNETFVFLNIRNPLIIPFGQQWDNIPYEELIKVFSENDLVNMINYEWSENYKNFDEYYITIEGSEPFLFSTDIVSNYVQSKKINDGIVIYNIDETAGASVNTNDYIVFKSNQIKLADGNNTNFDANNPDIRFEGGGNVSLNLIKKANNISNTNEYLNCDLFCHRMVDNKLFKDEFDIVQFKNDFKKPFDEQYNDLIKVLKVGDIIAFGDKNRVVHYSIYLGNDDVLEVEMWGEKPRKFSLKKNLYNYESIAFIYREKNNLDIRFDDGGNVEKKNKINLYIDSITDSAFFKSSYGTVRYGYKYIDVIVNMINKEYGYSKMKGKYAVISIGTEEIEGRSPNKKIFNTKDEAIFYIINNLTDEDNQYSDGGNVNDNLIPVQVKKTIYHTGNPMFRESILKQGLIPQGKSDTWLSDTPIEGEVIFAINSSDISDAWDSGYDDDIYEIDTTQLNNKWYFDPNFASYKDNDRIITFQAIPISAIKLVKEGSGEGYKKGGEVIINPTEIECHKCHWHWKVKDGGDDLFICHKCYYDNSKYYKFEGLEGQKILNTISYSQGGQSLSKTPAPKKERIYGSDKNKPESSKDTKSAEKIEFNDKTLETIKNKVAEHNEKNPSKKVTLASAKAVVRRGMGAYSSTHRPTISGGKPNSRVAWGLARLNAFFYKIINGKSKSGKYSQDNDLIEELGYKVQKYSDGGDIQAYEDAMNITFNDGGETKPKKVYVSIQFDSNIEKIPNTFNEYFTTYSEKTFEELKNRKLQGVIGVSSSPNNIAEWFILRDCLIVMNYDEFMAINDTEIIDYSDPYQLMKNNLFLFKRLYANISRYGEQENVFRQTLVKILEKVILEINLELNISEGQKAQELYRIARFLSPYNTRAFPEWIEKNSIKIESPIDLTIAILDFNKIDDSWLGVGFENPVLTFDELLPVIEKGVTNASKIYESEQEIFLTNRELNIPEESQLFFIGKNELNQIRQSNQRDLIEKYNLKEIYKIYFVDRVELEKYRSLWYKKQDKIFQNNLEKGKEALELKKDQVLEEILEYYLDKSLNSIKSEVEKYISDYSESFEYYDETTDDYVELNWYSIPIVESMFNTYIFIVRNYWKSFIQNKQVKNLDIYAFSRFQDEVRNQLKTYFSATDELDKLNNYRNTRGSGSLDAYLFERLFLKSVDDYENLPEWIDYKELAQIYLDKMGRELYRYYTKEDIQLISKYDEGGETNELNLTQNNTMNTNNPKDTITMDIPLLIRFSELMREDVKSDVQLHKIIENMLEIKDKGVLTMDDYDSIIGTDVQVEEETMEIGGNVNVIKSKKGDIQISLDENWYSDDSSVELVPVSELIKFREFDRKVSPKYNQDNSRDNIQHLKYMFQKQGVKSPLIIEYSPEDNSVLLIEGNHRLNSAIDLGMEYLPARVVLRKFGKFSPVKMKNTMQVVGIEPNKNNFIPTDLKPSHIGIAGSKPLAYAEGGIIEGRLHSECGEDGCGRKFRVGENGHIIEAERDEAVIVADAFNDNQEYTIEGTPSEVASALNVLGGGKSFDKGATIIKNGEELEIPLLNTQAKDTDVDDVIDSGSIIINRRSMADDKEYQVTGTPKQIASAINSLNGNGVVIEKGAEIKEN